MIDEGNILDPALNFTRSESQPYGARIPEFAIRQLVGFTLRKLRETASESTGVIDELFALHGAQTVKQIKGFLRDHPNLPVVVNWPALDMALPIICVVNRGEREDDAFSFLGDRAGLLRMGKMPGSRETVREQHAVGLRAELEIIVGTQDPDLTMYLHYMVKHALFSNKPGLSEFYDIHNLVIGARDLTLDTQLFPTFGYYKAVTLNFQTMFDFASEPVGSLIVDFGLFVEADLDGLPVVSTVPEK